MTAAVGAGRAGSAPAPARRRDRTTARLRGDGGSAIVEAALIGPTFVYLMFGIVEFGRAFFAYQSAVSAVQAAGRGAQIANANALADYTILSDLINSGRGFDIGALRYIVVWHAATDTS